MLLFGSAPPRTDVYGDPLPDGARVRMGTLKLRHENADVTFAADGKTLISCGPDGMVRHWDVASGKLLRQKRLWKLEKEKSRYRNVALAPKGEMAAALEEDKVYLYSVASGRELSVLSLGPIHSAWLKFAPSGKLLAVRTHDGHDKQTLQLWDVPAGKKCRTLTPEKGFSEEALSRQGDLAATRTLEGVLDLWDISTGKQLRSIAGVGWGMTFSPDGKTLTAVGMSDAAVQLWETASGKKQATLPVPKELQYRLVRFAFSVDGTRLAGAAQPGLVVWDVAARKVVRQLPEGNLMAAAFAPDGQTLACWGFGKEIRLWDVATGKQKHERPGHDDNVNVLALSRDGKIVASACHQEPYLYLWDAATGRLLRRLKGSDDWIQACAFSTDGKQVVANGCRGALQLWDVAGGKEVRSLAVPGVPAGNFRPFYSDAYLRFALDGKRLSILRISDDPRQTQVSIWDPVVGKLLSQRLYKVDVHTRLQPNGGSVHWIETHAAFSADAASVTVRSGKHLAIEDAKSGRVLAVLPENVGRPVMFSPDGQLVAAAALKPKEDPFEAAAMEGMRLIESATGQEVARIPTGKGHLVDFSGDGRLLAKIDKEAIHIWDVSSGKEFFRRAWPEGVVHNPDWAPASSLAFLPNGRGIVTGMDDGTILVWDVPAQSVQKTPPPSRQTLEALWSDLAGEARKAHRAVYTLATTPTQTLPFLAKHLQAAEEIDARRVTKLLADLDSDQFAVREAATGELLRLSDEIEAALRRFLQSKPSLEARRRVEAIRASARPVPSRATLRTIRAIRILESLDTAEARELLHKLCEGAVDARATREANAALERLRRR
jgi:WD40 repeat protein